MTEPRKTTEAAREALEYWEGEIILAGRNRDAFIESIEQIETAIREQERQRYRELVSAAQPLAEFAALFDPPNRPPMGTADDAVVYEYNGPAGVHIVNAGMFRRLRAALPEEGRAHDE